MEIHPTAVVHESAQLAPGVQVGAYAYIGPEVSIGPGTRVDHHAGIECLTTIGADCHVWPFASIGTDPQDLKFGGERTSLQIGDRVQIREFVTMNRGTGEGGGVTRVGDDCLFMSYSHVAHDCQLGQRVIMANSATLAGHVHVEDFVNIGGLVAIHQFTRLGTRAFIGGMSGVAQDQPPYCLCEGNRCKPHGMNVIGLRRAGFATETIDALKTAYRIIFRTHTPIQKAMDQVRAEVSGVPEVDHLLDFIASSERGVAR
ncbi:MAG: acyl-ACP--UDP-N-acetylglucosamine O-acyltransferase [Proteobacteria bacterium]|nr:acyl-ACP--UDP-N-acetylglucosamine O-acyltransferase [Pseudomonadota bacterium]MBU1452998.1 acyl-ACP--UDP-N-acetylglucosamine O-acyltransferase [Pseudomonadota bacterium]MBU2469505.1 acyl-ACP--UDP-N-acetylglucosamine O-acyltransferase [Pseudomonadota bacterium]MBU2518834.1 acyl-ACP--UDP-N-acetylglucosamine O-acyltransferase [Pseudomonadota bacterium]